MKEIKRTLGDLKNMVIDAEQKDYGTSYLVPIEIKPEEQNWLGSDATENIILARAKEIAKDLDGTGDWRSGDWDEFCDNVQARIIESSSFSDFSNSLDKCEAFLARLPELVEKIVEDSKTKMYEVSITITAKADVTIPVLARSREDAEDWVNNMPHSDIDYYREGDMEIDDTDIYDVDECTDMTPDDYGRIENAID